MAILFVVLLVTFVSVSTVLSWDDLEDKDDLIGNCIHYCGNKREVKCPPNYTCEIKSCGSECVLTDPPLEIPTSTTVSSWDELEDRDDLIGNCIHYCGNKPGVRCPPDYTCEIKSCGSECVVTDPHLERPMFCIVFGCDPGGSPQRQHCPLGLHDMEGCPTGCGNCGRLWLVESIEQHFHERQRLYGINQPGAASQMPTSFLYVAVFIIGFVTTKAT